MTSTNINEILYYGLNQIVSSDSSRKRGKNILAGFLVMNGIMPYDPATATSLNQIINLFSSPGDWIKVADPLTLVDFNNGYLNYTVNPKTKILELSIHGKLQDQAWGVTNPYGKILLAPRLIDGIEDNFWSASVLIHERKHFSNLKLGMYQGNTFIDNQ